MKIWVFLSKLNNCQLLNQDHVPWNYLTFWDTHRTHHHRHEIISVGLINRVCDIKQ